MRRERRHGLRLLAAGRGALALAAVALAMTSCARRSDNAPASPPPSAPAAPAIATPVLQATPAAPVRQVPGAGATPRVPGPRGTATAPPRAAASPSPGLASPPAAAGSPTPLPAAGQSSAPPHPIPASSGTPGVPMLRPHDPPQIVDLSLSPTTIGSGDTVVAAAVTSSNVASVEARVENLPNGMQLAGNLNKVGVGKFEMHYAIPALPWYAHGTYTVLVTARNVDGARATRTLAITVR